MSATEFPDEILERLRREREADALRPKPVERVLLAITGGRSYTPTRQDMERFWELFERIRPDELHHGDSRGVDHFVSAAVRGRYPDLPIVAHPAQWNLHGKRAGPHRNREMMLQAAHLIVFPGGKRTRSCEIAARQLNRVVHYVVNPLAPSVVEARPRRHEPHEHAVKEWRWSSPRACWWGRCKTCSKAVIADQKTAALLERLVEQAPARASSR